MSVSIICAGTMNWGTFNTEPEAFDQLDYAISEGVNFLDTAEMYPIPPSREKQGITETYLGNWMKARGSRAQLVVASKISSRNQAGMMATRDSSEGLTKKNIAIAIDGTLSRLQTDFVDLYQVHVPDRKANYFGMRGYEEPMDDGGASIEETLDGLSEIIKAGKVRYIGISNETAWGLGEYLRIAREKKLPKVSTIQNQYSLINRTFEIGLSEMCLKEDVGLLPYSPLSKGVLSGKYLGGVIPENSRFGYALRDIDRYNPSHAQPAIQAYADLARANGMEPAELALAWVNSRPFVTSNIIGTRSLEQMKTDVGTAKIVLSDDIQRKIAEIYKMHPDPTA